MTRSSGPSLFGTLVAVQSFSDPQSAEPMRSLASRTWGDATWVYRSVVVTRAWPRISWITRICTATS
jgi:hypothetical protein